MINMLERIGTRYENCSATGTVAASGGSEEIQVTVNEGEYVVIRGMFVSIPAIGGASGNHVLTLRVGETTSYILLAELSGTDGAAITISKSEFAADSESPSTAAMQQAIITGGHFMGNSDYPPTFKYVNNSDVNQTGTRNIRVFIEVYKNVL